jgi:hypothetical protein
VSDGGRPDEDIVNDPKFQGRRSLYLEDWKTLVHPHQHHAQQMLTHSVSYGSGALNASYLINGGALATLPAFLTIFTNAVPADVAWAAAPFVGAIFFTAISSTVAYLNWQIIAAICWHDAEHQGAKLSRFYDRMEVSDPDPAKRTRLEWWANMTFWGGLIPALVALLLFVWGAWGIFQLAANSQPAQSPKHQSQTMDRSG